MKPCVRAAGALLAVLFVMSLQQPALAADKTVRLTVPGCR